MNSLNTQATLARAHLLLRRQGTKSLPVIEDGRIVGIISESDIHKAIKQKEQSSFVPLTVGNYMTGPVKVIESDGQIDVPFLLKWLLEEDNTQAFVLTKGGRSQSILLRDELLQILTAKPPSN